MVFFDSGNRTGNLRAGRHPPQPALRKQHGLLRRQSRNPSLAAPSTSIRITVAVTAGDVISFRTTALSGGLVPFVEAYDPREMPCGAAARQNPSRDSHHVLPHDAPGNGPYTLLVRDNSTTAAATGSYVISMVRFNRPCTSQALTCSSLVDGAVSGILGVTQYTLEVSAGDVFLFRLLRTDQGSTLPPRLDVFDRQGRGGRSLSVTEWGSIFHRSRHRHLPGDRQRRLRQFAIGDVCAVVPTLEPAVRSRRSVVRRRRYRQPLASAGFGRLHLHRGSGGCVHSPDDR